VSTVAPVSAVSSLVLVLVSTVVSLVGSGFESVSEGS